MVIGNISTHVEFTRPQSDPQKHISGGPNCCWRGRVYKTQHFSDVRKYLWPDLNSPGVKNKTH